MHATETDTRGRRLCSFPLCGSVADWFTDFFGGTEYYCERHKPMIPQAFLKRPAAGDTGGSASK